MNLDTLKSKLPPSIKELKPLRNGGQKEVYEALVGKDRVALKVIQLTTNDSDSNTILEDDSYKRALRELKIAKIDSPYLAKSYDRVKPDFIEHDGQLFFYYAEYYINGANLREMLPLEISSRNDIIAEILDHVCEALAALWSEGYVHRDVKPANIMLDNTNKHFILIDAGIAYALNETSYTPSQFTVGTYPYTAPERFVGRKDDIRSDIYSLGIVAYELANGEHPYYKNGMERSELLKKISNYTPPPLSNSETGVDDYHLALVQRMINKRPHRRFKDPMTLLNNLTRK